MIRIRHIPPKVPFWRLYEVELSPHGWPDGTRRHVTRSPNSLLERILGFGDAWAFVHEADSQWANGKRGKAVEYEEDPQVLFARACTRAVPKGPRRLMRPRL